MPDCPAAPVGTGKASGAACLCHSGKGLTVGVGSGPRLASNPQPWPGPRRVGRAGAGALHLRPPGRRAGAWGSGKADLACLGQMWTGQGRWVVELWRNLKRGRMPGSPGQPWGWGWGGRGAQILHFCFLALEPGVISWCSACVPRLSYLQNGDAEFHLPGQPWEEGKPRHRPGCGGQAA